MYRELKRETTWARIHLVPLLLAEGDRAAYREGLRVTAIEAEIMRDVKGWVVSPLRCGNCDVED
jgi:NADH dehydrogenase (ubiquinone) 1 alpha subcomplex subunit 13